MIVPYPGSKLNAARDLVSYFPPTYSEYRDPFCGSGAMLWAVPTNVRRWVNDANPDIVALLRAAKRPDFGAEIVKRIAAFDDMDARRREHVLSCIGFYFEGNPVDHAMARGLSFGRMVSRHRTDIASFGRESRELARALRGWSAESMAALRSMLRCVKITCTDYSALLDAPGDDVVCLIDPPYFYPQHSRPIYDWDFTEADHRLLADRLSRCGHRFVLTVNICGLTTELYEESKRYEVYRMPYRYSVFSSADQPERYEYVITNF